MGNADHDPAGDSGGNGNPHAETDDALWLALCLAPDEGTDVGELMRLTGMEAAPSFTGTCASTPKRAAPSKSAGATGAPDHRGAITVSDRLTVRLVSRLARASARKRAYTGNGTNDGTSTERRIQRSNPP